MWSDCERLWRTRFNAADVLGKTVTLDGRTHGIIGVMPRVPRAGPSGPLARSLDPGRSWPDERSDLRQHDTTSFEIFARLRPGISVEEAQAASLIVRRREGRTSRVNDHADRMEVFQVSGLGAFAA